ncbi:MAG: alpha-amylase family glycosyl hydrolase [Cyclonatronaceae bacterium]
MSTETTERSILKSYSLGCRATASHSEFRLYCPRAKFIILEIFDHYEQTAGRRYPLNRNGGDVWQLTLSGDYRGKLYAYKIVPASGELPEELAGLPVVADPYSRQVITQNNYLQHPKSVIPVPEAFDWEGDDFASPADIRDLVIYETHLKDMTAHPSAGCQQKGDYRRFWEQEDGCRGGINHLKKLGVNAVEFLPLQKFAYFEPPHNEPIAEGIMNTWNYYGRNYWGYMTSFFFAPESIYASDGSTEPEAIIGKTQAAIRELKELVKALHKEGITVILDVVFNHVSQYDLNPFKLIDKEAYFRLTENGEYTSHSGCGNDFKTEAPAARRLIIDTLLFWMEEFHIDGFRFDLANLIDRETLLQIKQETEAVNPNVLLIAEPWGGGYNPTGFSDIGWASWNDQIRNGVKGSEPKNGKGFIFGKWHWESSRQGLENFLSGSLLGYSNGRYHSSKHCVNYLESHDGYTLGDFIRIGLDAAKAQGRHTRGEMAELSADELKLSRLAALFLLSAQGTPMIHAGQEWSRSKVIEPVSGVEDPDFGKLDHNSYEKDNATNYLDFDQLHLPANNALMRYYKGLIALRLSAPALRKARPQDLRFWNYRDSLLVTLSINGEAAGDAYDYIITLNGNPFGVHKLQLPGGLWEIVASPDIASARGFDLAAEELHVEASSGYILRRLRNKK